MTKAISVLQNLAVHIDHLVVEEEQAPRTQIFKEVLNEFGGEEYNDLPSKSYYPVEIKAELLNGTTELNHANKISEIYKTSDVKIPLSIGVGTSYDQKNCLLYDKVWVTLTDLLLFNIDTYNGKSFHFNHSFLSPWAESFNNLPNDDATQKECMTSPMGYRAKANHIGLTNFMFFDFDEGDIGYEDLIRFSDLFYGLNIGSRGSLKFKAGKESKDKQHCCFVLDREPTLKEQILCYSVIFSLLGNTGDPALIVNTQNLAGAKVESEWCLWQGNLILSIDKLVEYYNNEKPELTSVMEGKINTLFYGKKKTVRATRSKAGVPKIKTLKASRTFGKPNDRIKREINKTIKLLKSGITPYGNKYAWNPNTLHNHPTIIGCTLKNYLNRPEEYLDSLVEAKEIKSWLERKGARGMGSLMKTFDKKLAQLLSEQVVVNEDLNIMPLTNNTMTPYEECILKCFFDFRGQELKDSNVLTYTNLLHSVKNSEGGYHLQVNVGIGKTTALAVVYTALFEEILEGVLPKQKLVVKTAQHAIDFQTELKNFWYYLRFDKTALDNFLAFGISDDEINNLRHLDSSRVQYHCAYNTRKKYETKLDDKTGEVVIPTVCPQTELDVVYGLRGEKPNQKNEILNNVFCFNALNNTWNTLGQDTIDGLEDRIYQYLSKRSDETRDAEWILLWAEFAGVINVSEKIARDIINKQCRKPKEQHDHVCNTCPLRFECPVYYHYERNNHSTLIKIETHKAYLLSGRNKSTKDFVVVDEEPPVIEAQEYLDEDLEVLQKVFTKMVSNGLHLVGTKLKVAKGYFGQGFEDYSNFNSKALQGTLRLVSTGLPFEFDKLVSGAGKYLPEEVTLKLEPTEVLKYFKFTTYCVREGLISVEDGNLFKNFISLLANDSIVIRTEHKTVDKTYNKYNLFYKSISGLNDNEILMSATAKYSLIVDKIGVIEDVKPRYDNLTIYVSPFSHTKTNIASNASTIFGHAQRIYDAHHTTGDKEILIASKVKPKAIQSDVDKKYDKAVEAFRQANTDGLMDMTRNACIGSNKGQDSKICFFASPLMTTLTSLIAHDFFHEKRLTPEDIVDANGEVLAQSVMYNTNYIQEKFMLDALVQHLGRGYLRRYGDEDCFGHIICKNSSVIAQLLNEFAGCKITNCGDVKKTPTAIKLHNSNKVPKSLSGDNIQRIKELVQQRKNSDMFYSLQQNTFEITDETK